MIRYKDISTSFDYNDIRVYDTSATHCIYIETDQ